MAKFIKPTNLNKVWSISGDNTAPSDAKINLGWVSEVPPRQFFNFLDNRQDLAIAAINQSGIPEWDNQTEYQGNFSYTLGSNGTVYKCVTTHINIDPVTDTANIAWKPAFAPADGPIALNGKITLPNGSAADPQYSFANGTGSGLFLDQASGSIGIAVNGNEKARFSNSSITLSQPVSVAANSTGATAAPGDNSTKLATTEFVTVAVQDAGTYTLGIGAIIAYPMPTLPTGFLECNGQAVSRAVYADLFAYLGVAYGAGDGVTTFNVPDYRGEFLRGWDNGRGVDIGRSLGSSQADAIKAHTHTASTDTNGVHTHPYRAKTQNENSTQSSAGTGPFITKSNFASEAGTVANAGTASLSPGFAFGQSIGGAGAHAHTVTVDSTGGVETRPRNVTVIYGIKF